MQASINVLLLRSYPYMYVRCVECFCNMQWNTLLNAMEYTQGAGSEEIMRICKEAGMTVTQGCVLMDMNATNA